MLTLGLLVALVVGVMMVASGLASLCAARDAARAERDHLLAGRRADAIEANRRAVKSRPVNPGPSIYASEVPVEYGQAGE